MPSSSLELMLQVNDQERINNEAFSIISANVQPHLSSHNNWRDAIQNHANERSLSAKSFLHRANLTLVLLSTNQKCNNLDAHNSPLHVHHRMPIPSRITSSRGRMGQGLSYRDSELYVPVTITNERLVVEAASQYFQRLR